MSFPTLPSGEKDLFKIVAVLKQLSAFCSRFGSTTPRELLTANRTYYVRADGSDSNDGRVDSAGGAFLTLQKAYDVITGTLDLGGKTVTVTVRAGTYTGGLLAAQSWTGGGSVTFSGDTSTPGNVVISTTAAHCFSIESELGGVLTVQGFKLQTATSGAGLRVVAAARVNYNSLNFGPCVNPHLLASAPGAFIAGSGNYTISGGSQNHFAALDGGEIFHIASTITVSDTPAFSLEFARARRHGNLFVLNNLFSGPATGKRFLADLNGTIAVNGASVNYFPGDVAGTSGTTGGQYG